MFKKENFPTTLFITASLLALLVFLVLFFVFSINMGLAVDEEKTERRAVFSKYFLKDTKNMDDPMMTRVPKLRDFIDGPIISSVDPGIGKIDSPVNIVIYSDFECKYCANQEKVIKRAIGDYKDKVRFIWKDYPEVNLMSDSFQASIAGRCAQVQGNFWNFHDLVFDLEDGLGEDVYYGIARDLDLDMPRFEKCFTEQQTRKMVLDNMIEADALGITGIPFMYVNNQELVGEVEYENLKKIIEIQLEKTQEDVQ